MPGRPYRNTPEKKAAFLAACSSSRTRAEAAEKLGMSLPAFDAAARIYEVMPGSLFLPRSKAEPNLVVEAPPDPDLPVEEVLKIALRRQERLEATHDARRQIPVYVKDSEALPIGLHFFGDPHVDSPGTNLRMLLRHSEIVRKTPGVFAANVGDTRDNWTGRLARLFEDASITGSESVKLARYWIAEAVGPEKWAFILGGNHDLWSGTGDPIAFIAGQIGTLYQGSQARIQLRFPGKVAPVGVNCRHDFPGHSQWNTAHGVAKWLRMVERDDLAIAGHRHHSGYNQLWDPEGRRLMHAVRVATYKVIDRYATEGGFADGNVSPAAFITIEPRLPPNHPDRLKLWHDPEEGASFVTWARKRKRAAA